MEIKHKKKIIIFAVFFCFIISTSLIVRAFSQDVFFESCDDLSEWSIVGSWVANAFGQCESTGFSGSHNMTTQLDLTGYMSANISFNWNTTTATNLSILINSTSTPFTAIFSTSGTGSGSVVRRIEDYITLPASPYLRGECRRSPRGSTCILDDINVTGLTKGNCQITGTNNKTVTCSNCSINSNLNMAGNTLTFVGNGYVILNASIVNREKIVKANSCTIIKPNSAGEIKI